MSFTWLFLHGAVFFLTALPCSGGNHMEWDTVGINCRKGELLKIKTQVLSIWAKGCILMIECVCVI